MNTRNRLVSRLFASTIAITLVLAIVPATPAFAGTPMCTPGESVELGLAIDGSGSISTTNFDLQQDAYASVLAGLPITGQVSVAVTQFSTGLINEFPIRNIDSQADLDDLIQAINDMVQIGLNTAIGDAIDSLSTELSTSGINADVQIIDVSTDGINNVGGSPVTAAQNAVNNDGIEQVNALGIGVMPNFNFGVGSFSVEVADFADFEAALADKIMAEICDSTVAGELLPINTTALFVSGAFANAFWMLPMLAGIAGTGIYLTRSRWNKA